LDFYLQLIAPHLDWYTEHFVHFIESSLDEKGGLEDVVLDTWPSAVKQLVGESMEFGYDKIST